MVDLHPQMRALWCGCCAALVGCGQLTDTPAPTGGAPVDGVEEVSLALADLSAQCAFVSGTGVMTLTLVPDDLAMIARSATGTIEVNGYPCGATTLTLKRLDVREGSSGDQTLILDFRGGLFGAGTSAGPGITIDLGGEATLDALKVIGTPGADAFVFGAAGISLNPDAFLDVTMTHVEQWVVNLDAGNDSFSGMGNTATGGAPFASALAIFGGEGNDTLRGGTAADTYMGGNGDDTFVGGPAADGGDTLSGGAGVDTADYSARTTALVISLDGTANDGAVSEADDLASDIETIKGGTAADTITGGPGAEALYGGPGDDTLAGGPGADTLYGDAGNDTFDEGNSASGADVFNGGAGIDTLTYAGRTNAVSATIDGIVNDGEAGELDKIATDVENLIGGAGNDVLGGSAAANVLEGRDGDDTISGGGGDDVLRGGTGANVLAGDAGNDRFDQGSAADGDDVIHGGAGVDTVDYSARTNALAVVMDGTTPGGEAGEADLVGTDLENLVGGAGDDALTGNAGDNQLEGGIGSDTLANFGSASAQREMSCFSRTSNWM